MAPYIRTTAGQSNISAEGLRQLAIPLPPIESQRSFKERMYDFYKIRRQTLASSETLETLFQNLLHRAFSGDLTAEWRKGHMAELLQEMEHQTKVLGLERAVEYEQLGILEK
jgi:type I restriction enzyme S subunit